MVYEYTTTLEFPLIDHTTTGWYTTKEAIKKMVRYYNYHGGCKAPVVIETKTGIEKTVGTVDSSKKLIVEPIDEKDEENNFKCRVKVPVLLRTDFNPAQFNVVADLYKVETDSFYHNMLLSFKIQYIVAIPKED